MIDTNLIFADDQYKQYCKSVSNYSPNWEDLYQEFAVELLTKKHVVRGNIESYCKGVIYKTWRRLTGYGHGSKSESMLLANYADRSVEVTDNVIIPESFIDNRPVEELEKLLMSENRNTRLRAEITKDFIEGGNRRRISQERGINYRKAHEAVEITVDKIKTNMTKNDIQMKFLSEGIKASYSGKNKTFYVSKEPSKELQEKITKAGFKQAKR